MPVLWDKKENTIVNNESADIVRMFNNAFNELATKPELDLCALLVPSRMHFAAAQEQA